MKNKIIISTLFILLLSIMISPAYATLTNLGYNIDVDYSVMTTVTQYKTQPRPAFVDTSGTDAIYVNALTSQADPTKIRLFTTSLSNTGTVNGVIGYCDVAGYDASGAIAHAVIPVNRSTDPQLFAVLYRKQTSNKATVGTFTVTSSGSVSGALLDTYDVWAAAVDAGDGFYVTDGIVVAYFVDSTTHRAYSLSIDNSGDIDDGGPIDTHANLNGYDYSFSVFPVSNPDDYEGGGWWGSTSNTSGTAKQVVLNTFYVDNSGNFTDGDKNKQPTNLKYRGDYSGPPVNIRGSDYWLFGYSPSTDDTDGYACTLEITATGSISATMTDSFEFQNAPTTYCSKFWPFYIGGNRYGIVYANGAGVNSPNIVVFDLDTDGTIGLANKVGNELYNASPWCANGWRVYPVEGANRIWAVDWYLNNTISTFTYGMYVPPTVSTTSILKIDDTSAYGSGLLTAIGSTYPTVVGVCWSDFSAAPTTTGSHTATTGVYDVDDTWTDEITGLAENTKYWMRAYASNVDGTGYGATIVYYTGPPYTTALMLFEYDADHISGTPTYTIQDQSAYNHDATYTLASNPSGISGTMGPLSPYAETDASYLVADETSLLWDAPDEPERMYEEKAVEGLFGIPGQSVDNIADAWGVTSAIIWAIVCTVCLVIIGMGATRGVHSPFFTALMQGGTIFVCYVMGIFPGWLAFTYVFAATGVVVSRKFY